MWAPVDSGFGVTGLGLRCYGADFHEAKAQVVPDREELAVFVHAGGESDSVGEEEVFPFEGLVDRWWAHSGFLYPVSCPVEGQGVCGFGLQLKEGFSDEVVEGEVEGDVQGGYPLQQGGVWF